MGNLQCLQADRHKFGHQDEVVYVWQRLKLVQGCDKAKENAITTLLACLLPKICRILCHLMHCTLYTLKKYEFY